MRKRQPTQGQRMACSAHDSICQVADALYQLEAMHTAVTCAFPPKKADGLVQLSRRPTPLFGGSFGMRDGSDCVLQTRS